MIYSGGKRSQEREIYYGPLHAADHNIWLAANLSH